MKWMTNTVDSSERLTECYLDINYPELPKIHQLQDPPPKKNKLQL